MLTRLLDVFLSSFLHVRFDHLVAVSTSLSHRNERLARFFKCLIYSRPAIKGKVQLPPDMVQAVYVYLLEGSSFP